MICRMPKQVAGLERIELPNLAVVPATLPLSYALKPNSFAWRGFDIHVRYPLYEGAGGQDFTL